MRRHSVAEPLNHVPDQLPSHRRDLPCSRVTKGRAAHPTNRVSNTKAARWKSSQRMFAAHNGVFSRPVQWQNGPSAHIINYMCVCVCVWAAWVYVRIDVGRNDGIRASIFFCPERVKLARAALCAAFRACVAAWFMDRKCICAISSCLSTRMCVTIKFAFYKFYFVILAKCTSPSSGPHNIFL